MALRDRCITIFLKMEVDSIKMSVYDTVLYKK